MKPVPTEDLTFTVIINNFILFIFSLLYHELGDSGKHKIVYSGPYDLLDFHSGTKKTVMPKKKVFAVRNLKDCTKFTPQNKKEKKRKSKFFISSILCFPER
jgi:hypothetical protein